MRRYSSFIPASAELQVVLDSFNDESLVAKRDRAILAVIAYCFARLREVKALDVGDFRIARGQGWLRLGLGGTEREVALNLETSGYLKSYLDSAGICYGDDGPLFRQLKSSGLVTTGDRIAASLRAAACKSRQRTGNADLASVRALHAAGLRALADSGATIGYLVEWSCLPYYRIGECLTPEQRERVFGHIPERLRGGLYSIPSIISDAGVEATNSFLEFLLKSYRTDATRRKQSEALHQFGEWCKEKQLSLLEIRRGHVVSFLKDLEERYSASTCGVYQLAVRKLFSWLCKRRILSDDPAEKVFPSRGKEGLYSYSGEVLESHEIDRLFNCKGCVGRELTVVEHRDKAVLALLLYGLADAMDVEAASVEDFFQKGGTWWIRLHGRGKSRDVPVNAELERYLLVYLDKAAIASESCAPLFRTRDQVTKDRLTGKRMSRGAVKRMVFVRVRYARIAKRITMASLRATSVRNFLHSGGTIEGAAYLTGLSLKGVGVYLQKKVGSIIYEGDLDGLLDFLSDSAAEPLREYVERSGIFRLTVTPENEKEGDTGLD